jgi:hypothetical protein
MNLKPYAELLAMSQEAVNGMLAPIRAAKVRKKAEMKMLDLDLKMANLEQDVNELCAQNDIDFDRIIAKQNEYALAEREKKQLATIIAQLFPE